MRSESKIIPKIARIFQIWTERNIYPDEFIKDLKQILNGSNETATTTSAKNNFSSSTNLSSTKRVATDFLLSNLEKRTKEIETIEKTTKTLLATLNIAKIDKIDSHILSHLKDKNSGEQCCKELTEIENELKNAVLQLEKQVNARSTFLDTLDKCELFHETQKSEVKIVANAYKNFTTRVKAVNSKLSSNQITFPSPYPSPIIDAPSPNSDDDFVLPSGANADANSPPLAGLNSLLNVLSENSNKNSKISSLDKRLSSLMQNLPSMKKELKNSDKSWSPLLNNHQQQQQQQNIQTSSQINSSNAQINQMNQLQISSHQPTATILHQQQQQQQQLNVNNMNFMGYPMKAPPPIINHQQQHLNLPLPPLPPNLIQTPHHQSFIPQIQQQATASHAINESTSYHHHHDYYNSQIKSNNNHNNNRFMNHSLIKFNQNPYGNNNDHTSNSAIQQIKSVISTRNEQQQQELDDSLPYDPYDSIPMNNTMDSFEPTDMELGNSDDEEMNRSSNSQRVLKVIETSDDSFSSSSNKKSNAYKDAYNFQSHQQHSHHHQPHLNHHQTNFINTAINTNLTPHLPPPQLPQKSNKIPSLNLSNNTPFNTHSNLNTNLNTAINTNLTPNLVTNSSLTNLHPQHQNYANGQHNRDNSTNPAYYSGKHDNRSHNNRNATRNWKAGGNQSNAYHQNSNPNRNRSSFQQKNVNSSNFSSNFNTIDDSNHHYQ